MIFDSKGKKISENYINVGISELNISNFSNAKYLGTPKSARMVGWAMNASHVNPKVPAHRVVNRIGFVNWKASFFWF